jgi:hypothetical protein
MRVGTIVNQANKKNNVWDMKSQQYYRDANFSNDIFFKIFAIL